MDNLNWMKNEKKKEMQVRLNFCCYRDLDVLQSLHVQNKTHKNNVRQVVSHTYHMKETTDPPQLHRKVRSQQIHLNKICSPTFDLDLHILQQPGADSPDQPGWQQSER